MGSCSHREKNSPSETVHAEMMIDQKCTALFWVKKLKLNSSLKSNTENFLNDRKQPQALIDG
ncbi:hypothetical protein T09_8965 [Trichinella sp. T9]|nr:hypothetical protein T09_8965 [Trichinella sp. T9]